MMRLTMLAVAFALALVSPLSAQGTPQYRDPWVAAGLELVLPTLGNGYAGDLEAGVGPLIITFSGVVMAIKANRRSDVNLGIAVASIGRVIGVARAVRGARRANEGVAFGLLVEPAPTGGIKAGLALSF